MSTLLAALLLAAPQAGAMPPLPACAGTYATIRTSAIKPGKWADFEKAVAAHNAWYVSKQSKTTNKLARVLARTPAGVSFSTTEAVTITVYYGGMDKQPERDAAYSAFVSAYQASSDMKSEVRVCLPKL